MVEHFVRKVIEESSVKVRSSSTSMYVGVKLELLKLVRIIEDVDLTGVDIDGF